MVSEMTSAQPYLIRAFFDWIVDNGLTPYLLVQTGLPEVRVPERHINDGKIVLNINPHAVRQLALENDYIEFNARFDGASMHVSFPIESVLAIYAKENGQGMNFDLVGDFSADKDVSIEAEGKEAFDNQHDLASPPPRPKGRPKLTLV